MNVHCIVMFEFNYSFRDIKIFCLGEGSGGKGEELWKGGREVGEKGRKVGVRGEVGNAYPPPPSPVHPPLWATCMAIENGRRFI